MNRITLKRLEIFSPRNGAYEMQQNAGPKITVFDKDFRPLDVTDEVDPNKSVIVYRVLAVVGSIKPYVGEYLTPEYVADICDQTGVWIVNFK